MMTLWEYVLGGATVFGLIVTIGAWLNGRITRREISRLIMEEHRTTRELITRMDERFELLLRESSEAHSKILEAIREIASRLGR